MTLLLDAHALLWFLSDHAKLSVAAKAALVDPANERWLSPISYRICVRRGSEQEAKPKKRQRKILPDDDE